MKLVLKHKNPDFYNALSKEPTPRAGNRFPAEDGYVEFAAKELFIARLLNKAKQELASQKRNVTLAVNHAEDNIALSLTEAANKNPQRLIICKPSERDTLVPNFSSAVQDLARIALYPGQKILTRLQAILKEAQDIKHDEEYYRWKFPGIWHLFLDQYPRFTQVAAEKFDGLCLSKSDVLHFLGCVADSLKKGLFHSAKDLSHALTWLTKFVKISNGNYEIVKNEIIRQASCQLGRELTTDEAERDLKGLREALREQVSKLNSEIIWEGLNAEDTEEH